MKLFGGILVLLMGIIISIVAAWFSVTGMVALFNASAMGVLAMMVSLEAGKLVASGWLKMNWANKGVSILHRAYLLCAVIVLCIITSIGIYGYLAAGHLEQAAPRADIAVQSQPLELQLQQKNQENERLNQRLNQIDQNIGVFLKNDKATQGLKASNSLKRERDDIQKKIDENNTAINGLNEKLAPLKMQSNEVEAKLGAVKYFAEFVGWSEESSAVNFIIFMLMAAFDPLAIVLLLSALTTFRELHEAKHGKREEEEEAKADERWNTFFSESRGALADVDMSDMGDDWSNAKSLDDIVEDEVLSVEPEVESDEIVLGDDEDDKAQADEWEIERQRAAERADQLFNDLETAVKQEKAEKEALLAQVAALQAGLAAKEGLLDAVVPEIEDRSDYDRAGMGEEVAFEIPVEADEQIVRLAGLRPETEREIIAHEIPLLESPPEDDVDVQPVDAKEVDRDTLIGILERHPNILNEIEQIVEEDVVEELTDREKLLDLLEKNPDIINDMAAIMASQLSRNDKPLGDSWLKD